MGAFPKTESLPHTKGTSSCSESLSSCAMIIEKQNEAGQQKPRRRFWRFSLKTLLILLTLFCLWLGTLASSANRQKRAVEAIQLSGGEFNYDYQRIPSSSGQRYSHRVEPPGPQWLRRVLGDHYFITPVALNIGRQAGIKDDCLDHLVALPHLKSAMFYQVPFRDRDVVHLKHLKNLTSLTFNEGTLSGIDGPTQFEFLKYLPHLESLSLNDAKFGDADAKFLKDTVNLKILFIYGSAIGDDGLAQLQHLKNLEMIGLGKTKVTDRGISYLSALPKLRYISANDLNITDEAFGSFAKMTALRDLELHNTQYSREGIEKLRKAMPKCEINGKGGDGTPSSESIFGF